MATYAQVDRSRMSIIPFAAICCLGLILFLFSSTIILSLIPIYLPIHDQLKTASSISDPQSTIFTLSGGNTIVSGSSLDTATQKSIEDQMQNALTTGSTTSRNIPTVHVLSATGTSSSRRRKREITTNKILVIYQLSYTRICVTFRCQRTTLNFAQIKFSLLTITISISSATSAGTNPTNIATTIATTTNNTNSTTATNSDDQVTDDINKISNYWANTRPYKDSAENYFGVNDTGLPDGCQVEQVHILHRHGARYPTTATTDGANINRFAIKIQSIRTANSNNTNNKFTGPLTFLNTWTLRLGFENLVGRGATESYQSGVEFWNKYGRILYNAQPGQIYYNDAGQTKILLRTNSVLRMYESALHWAEGFFGLYNLTNKYSLLSLSSTVGTNNTLSGNLNCRNALSASTSTVNQTNFNNYAATVLSNATQRLSAYAPSNANLNVNDTFAMLFICAYEYSALGSSDFCSLFTVNEWRGFEQLFNVLFYQSYSYGGLTSRAQGIGYLEELLARLNKTFINISYSSINSTLDSSSTTFPLNQLFYLDMANDVTILNFLTALSLDYFRENVSFTYPLTDDNRHFRLSYLTPFAARIFTEKIGCISSSPQATNATRTEYSQTQYSYSADKAIYKFIRMRLNNGILPLNTLRGGLCSIGRTDGLCPMDNFVASQKNASARANFQYVCYGNYTYNATTFTGDGTV